MHQNRKYRCAIGSTVGRLAGQKLAVGAHLVGLGIDLDLGAERIVHHVLLADLARALHRQQRPREAPLLGHALGDRGLRHEDHRAGDQAPAEGAEHRPVVHRLRRRDRGVGIAHRRGHDRAADQHHVGLGAEEGRRPDHQVGALADLDRADMARDAVGDGGIDRVLGDVALDADIVVVAGLLLQPAALLLHLVGGLPGADHDLADPAHRLAVGRHHREGAHVVQDVLGGDRLLADAALGEGHVLGDARGRDDGRPSACRDARPPC